jgi:hypothetical protein
VSTNEQLRAIARALDDALNGTDPATPKRNGFVVLIYPIGAEPGRRVNYISNVERKEMLVALKEIVARFEGRVQETDEPQ